MILVARRILALLAICGLAASVYAYIGSYIGTTMESLQWADALHIGIFILVLPMFALDYPLMKQRTSFWKAFSQGMPTWVIPTIALLGVFSGIHFFLFLLQSHGASPQIRNGEYVLDNHGQIAMILTQREYLMLKGAELRMFAMGWTFLYFIPAAYWWFPRNRETQVRIGTTS